MHLCCPAPNRVARIHICKRRRLPPTYVVLKTGRQNYGCCDISTKKRNISASAHKGVISTFLSCRLAPRSSQVGCWRAVFNFIRLQGGTRGVRPVLYCPSHLIVFVASLVLLTSSPSRLPNQRHDSRRSDRYHHLAN